METQTLKLDRAKALELYRSYKKHQHYSEPIDREIQRAYQLIAQGRMVIRALDSIKSAGLHVGGPNDALPKLALLRADAKICHLEMYSNGSARFAMESWPSYRNTRSFVSLPSGTFPPRASNARSKAQAIVPIVPIHLRPKRAMENYHVLWEAEWQKIVPLDPMLLRRIGGDMWLVVAAWDLTEVERAAMATRISS